MSDRPTPETAPLMHAAANESIEAVFLRGCDLERQRDAYAETLRLVAAANDRSHHEAAFTALIRERHPELADCLPPGSLFGIGDSVKVAEGASKWMRERGFWIDEWPESIDGMTFKVVADCTNLSGKSAHWWLENDAVKDCGVHPQWLTPNVTTEAREK